MLSNIFSFILVSLVFLIIYINIRLAWECKYESYLNTAIFMHNIKCIESKSDNLLDFNIVNKHNVDYKFWLWDYRAYSISPTDYNKLKPYLEKIERMTK